LITTIKRYTETEIQQAIDDLVERKFTLIYGPAEIKVDTTRRGNYNYKRSRYESMDRGTTSFWIAKLSVEDKQRQVMTRSDKEGNQ
jgi:hypothetical protein